MYGYRFKFWGFLFSLVVFGFAFNAKPLGAMAASQASSIAAFCSSRSGQLAGDTIGEAGQWWVYFKTYLQTPTACDSSEPSSKTGWCQIRKEVTPGTCTGYSYSYSCTFTNPFSNQTYTHLRPPGGGYSLHHCCKSSSVPSNSSNCIAATRTAKCSSYSSNTIRYFFTGNHCASISPASCTDPYYSSFCNSLNNVSAAQNTLIDNVNKNTNQLTQLQTDSIGHDNDISFLKRGYGTLEGEVSEVSGAVNSIGASLRDVEDKNKGQDDLLAAAKTSNDSQDLAITGLQSQADNQSNINNLIASGINDNNRLLTINNEQNTSSNLKLDSINSSVKSQTSSNNSWFGKITTGLSEVKTSLVSGLTDVKTAIDNFKDFFSDPVSAISGYIDSAIATMGNTSFSSVAVNLSTLQGTGFLSVPRNSLPVISLNIPKLSFSTTIDFNGLSMLFNVVKTLLWLTVWFRVFKIVLE